MTVVLTPWWVQPLFYGVPPLALVGMFVAVWFGPRTPSARVPVFRSISIVSFIAAAAVALFGIAVAGQTFTDDERAAAAASTYGVTLTVPQLQDLQYPSYVPPAGSRERFGVTVLTLRGHPTSARLVWDGRELILVNDGSGVELAHQR
ncbi:hypothetical protein [Microbacterium sp. 4NA327F11]|uniref:hypothetical protein n=1 Tax=Microbacterium sp. 4NA327F11 TaxID=2502229 RepID=UPI0010F49218|nr:hypothetical protein [Microbacterium sp. 4NA327F11]